MPQHIIGTILVRVILRTLSQTLAPLLHDRIVLLRSRTGFGPSFPPNGLHKTAIPRIRRIVVPSISSTTISATIFVTPRMDLGVRLSCNDDLTTRFFQIFMCFSFWWSTRFALAPSSPAYFATVFRSFSTLSASIHSCFSLVAFSKRLPFSIASSKVTCSVGVPGFSSWLSALPRLVPTTTR